MNLYVHAHANGYKYHSIGKIPLKYLLVMKLTLLLTIALSLQVAANAVAQKIDLQVENEKLENVLKEMRKQSGYAFIYSSEYLRHAKPVTLHVTGKDIEETLSLLFAGQPFTYTIKDKVITIVPKKEPSINNPEIHQYNIRGRVTDSLRNPLQGVTVHILETPLQTITDRNGEYELIGVPQGKIIQFRLLSYEPYETPADRAEINVALKYLFSQLSEVILSRGNTGFQELPKERQNGSFTFVDNELLNRRVSTNILDRLEGVASGVRFQSEVGAGSSESPISIRGRSTIFSNTHPLIILDNFPYDGDLSNINPNDIENVTILKDASAASIWGARSSNGVIVITTKKGQKGRPMRTEFNSNVTIGQKPDLFYNPNGFINGSDFIDMETMLFENGYFNADLDSWQRTPVSPVVELLYQRREGNLSDAELVADINAYRDNDIRNDFSNHFYRNNVNQQYALNFNGGGENSSYYFSAGYDKNLHSLVGNQNDRLTIQANNTFAPIKNLEIAANLTYTLSNQQNNNSGTNLTMIGKQMPPYMALVDESGNALTVPRSYRQAFKDTTGNGLLLDWNYRPLDEISIADNTIRSNHIRLNPSIRYTFIQGLGIEFRYQFEKQTANLRNLQSDKSYATRNLINEYSQISGTNVIRNIPQGSILDLSNSELTGHRFRTQLNFDKVFNDVHDIIAIAGIENGKTSITGSTSRLYGYDEEIGTLFRNINYSAYYPFYMGIGWGNFIPFVDETSGTTDVNVSYFANTNYTYRNKYSFSASARIDQSNLFGVEFNQKGVPLWSVGAGWKVSDETFYSLTWLPYLRLRSSYGVNGNINKSVSALLTATLSSWISEYGNTYGTINNPPNPNLRWERNNTLNIGVDFSNHRWFEGSIEYFNRKGTDLIGGYAVPMSSGMDFFTANVADMESHGFDVELNTLNLKRRDFQWSSNFLFSYATDKVTQYQSNQTANTIVQVADGSQSGITPIAGKPVYSLYSFQWAGLDPANGNPQGYSDGVISTDYTSLVSPVVEGLIYHGPTRPRHFGSIRNTVSFKDISLSFNVTYKADYYFRAASVNYNLLFGSYIMHQDFSNRWQQLGDENNTHVPSLIYPANTNRDFFYRYSEALVHRGDHIRLQDLQLGYELSKRHWAALPFSNVQLYLYGNNLGILWKANKVGLDPDFLNGFPNPFTMAFGIKATY